MPATARDSLALRLRQNWMSKYPLDTCGNGGLNLDDSLTSLNWLQNLNIMKITSVAPPPSISPAPSFPSFQDTNNNKNLKVNPNAVLNVACAPPPCKMEPKLPLMDTPPLTPTTLGGESIDYKTNPYVKPPYSYATLICMAMKETKKTKITLSSIYNWITDNFMYYRLADPSWQNSIRHNLSLNKCFQKVPRRKDEPGKGGFWRINPEYSDMIENGIFKKRRNSRDACLPPNAKRVKKEDDDNQGALSDHFLFNTSGSHKRSSQHSQRGGDLLNLSHEAESLKGDFNWQSILNQDIEIGGVRVKTEYLIDTADPSLDSPSGAMSPPSSDSDDNFSIEDLLSTDLSNSETPIDFTTDNPLDLTLTGQQIRAPEWWDGSLGGMKIKTEPQSGLHTPIHVADHVDTDHAPHPWAEHDGLADIGHAFDVDNLFDIDNIPSPRLL